MKSIRQSKILELIKENDIDTQEELLSKLKEYGFNVTQATVSRDIRELGIVKSQGSDGNYKYRAGKEHVSAALSFLSVCLAVLLCLFADFHFQFA